MKKLVSLILVLALTLGCAAALAENKKMDTLTFQFVPSKDADVIIAGTANLPELVKAEMANLGYDIDEVDITVGTNYACPVYRKDHRKLLQTHLLAVLTTTIPI